jgi:pimeloyl-ACP methyl ester carboxylesterase
VPCALLSSFALPICYTRNPGGHSCAELGEEWEPEPSAADRLPDVQAPTLLIVGDEDQPRVFAAADLLEKELPNVRKVVMHGTAHVPNMERPEEFDRIVLDFLEGNPVAKTLVHD